MADYFNADPNFIIVPVMIREGVRVDIRIPANLTESEAKKVAAVVIAMAIKDPTS